MQRRHVLTIGTFVVAGCLNSQPPGNGDEPTDPSPTPSQSANGTEVSIVSRADQPDIPIAYTVEMAEQIATTVRPARIRVTISNTTESQVVLAEERAVQFHHVASTNETLYLHPTGDDTWTGPVDPGCWRLTEPVHPHMYYGTITLQEGETTHAESYVYGHEHLPEGTCLPEGDHQVLISGVVGDEESTPDGKDGTNFEWGFTLRINK